MEASSPALIEKTRTVVTDGQGLYSITALRPGTYTVSFSLPGFTTVRFEGIELTTSFTANVNAEMRVGGIEEAITVSGSSPTVDVQNVVQQKAFTREIIDALPTGSKSWASARDSGAWRASDRRAERRRHRLVERDRSWCTADRAPKPSCCSTACATTRATVLAESATPTTKMTAAVEELTFQTAALTAEIETGSFVRNIVPKEGGNRFTASSAPPTRTRICSPTTSTTSCGPRA